MTIGLDIVKSVFQVRGIDADHEVLIRRRPTSARMLPFFAKLPPNCLDLGPEHSTKPSQNALVTPISPRQRFCSYKPMVEIARL